MAVLCRKSWSCETIKGLISLSPPWEGRILRFFVWHIWFDLIKHSGRIACVQAVLLVWRSETFPSSYRRQTWLYNVIGLRTTTCTFQRYEPSNDGRTKLPSVYSCDLSDLSLGSWTLSRSYATLDSCQCGTNVRCSKGFRSRLETHSIGWLYFSSRRAL